MPDREPCVNLGADTPVDDLRPILNRAQLTNLRGVLEMTPADRRVEVMCAWIGLDRRRWARESGIGPQNISRWTSRKAEVHIRMPFGGAIRLARVIGVDAELLFEAYL